MGGLGIVGNIFLFVTLAGMIALLTWKVFKLVTAMPDRIIRRMGHGMQQLGSGSRCDAGSYGLVPLCGTRAPLGYGDSSATKPLRQTSRTSSAARSPLQDILQRPGRPDGSDALTRAELVSLSHWQEAAAVAGKRRAGVVVVMMEMEKVGWI